MTEVEAQKIIASLVAVFPSSMAKLAPEQQKLTEGVYRRMIVDLEYEAANAAVARLIATSKFLPVPAEIREAVFALTIGSQRQGGEAWGSVLKAIQHEGAYKMPGTDFVFHDPVTAKCVDSLGWRNLCLSENHASDRARFIELYDHLGAQHRQLQLSEGLPAMQRFREIQARQATEAKAVSAGDAVARVLRLVEGGKATS